MLLKNVKTRRLRHMSAYKRSSNGFILMEKKVKENFKDIRLSSNGSKVTFNSEVIRKAHSHQKKGSTPCLLHEIMLINHNIKSDTVGSIVESVLSNLEINWNVLSLRGRQLNTDKSEILGFLKPLKLAVAAKRAGLVKGNTWFSVLWITLVILLSMTLSGIVYVCFGGWIHTEPFSVQKMVNDTNFIIGWTVFSLTSFIVNIFVKRFQLAHNKRLQTALVDYTNRIQSFENNNNFVHEVCNEVLDFQMPLAIVVKDIDSVDVFTKKVLMEMLTVDSQQSVGLIFWILIDEEKSGAENELYQYAKKQGSGIPCESYRFESFVEP